MGLWIWLSRIGGAGSTARTLTRLFYTVKAKYPDKDEYQICQIVRDLRRNQGTYSRKQQARFDIMVRNGTLEGLVVGVVMIDCHLELNDLSIQRYMELDAMLSEEVAKARRKYDPSIR